jgi:hypothetical protein
MGNSVVHKQEPISEYTSVNLSLMPTEYEITQKNLPLFQSFMLDDMIDIDAIASDIYITYHFEGDYEIYYIPLHDMDLDVLSDRYHRISIPDLIYKYDNYRFSYTCDPIVNVSIMYESDCDFQPLLAYTCSYKSPPIRI